MNVWLHYCIMTITTVTSLAVSPQIPNVFQELKLTECPRACLEDWKSWLIDPVHRPLQLHLQRRLGKNCWKPREAFMAS